MEWILYTAIRVVGFIFVIKFFIYMFAGGPNIPDEDLDRVSKGGPRD